jgi:hypothetical protein
LSPSIAGVGAPLLHGQGQFFPPGCADPCGLSVVYMRSSGIPVDAMSAESAIGVTVSEDRRLIAKGSRKSGNWPGMSETGFTVWHSRIGESCEPSRGKEGAG